MTIGDILAQQTRERPDAPALIDARAGGRRRLTFAELELEVAGAAEWLSGYGLGKGSAVLVFVPMSVDLYVALLAMFRLGVVALFLDPSAGRTHIEHCCALWQPDALLAIPKAHLLRLRSPALRAIPRKIVVGGWVPGAVRWLRRCSSLAPASTPSEVAERDPALVTFTSGSTGRPKAAVRTHGFLLAQHRALAPSISLEPGEVDLATLPIFTLANLASGVTTVIPDVDLRKPGAIDASKLFAQIGEFRVTRITASPALFERLQAHARATGCVAPSLRKLHTGGAPVYPRLLDAMAEFAPKASRVAVYGSTEAEPIAHADAAEFTSEDIAGRQGGRGLLAGEPVAEISVRILRDQWGRPRGKMNAVELAGETLTAGEVGEIVVSGDHVLPGYLGGVGDAETKFSVDGVVWHRTGDAGRLDAQGRLWLLGRCAAKVEDARGVLYPFAVECVAMTFPAVRRAALVAAGGKRLLLVELAVESSGLVDELRAALLWAHVDEVRTIKRLPLDKRHNAKIDYPALRRELGLE